MMFSMAADLAVDRAAFGIGHAVDHFPRVSGDEVPAVAIFLVFKVEHPNLPATEPDEDCRLVVELAGGLGCHRVFLSKAVVHANNLPGG